MIKSYTLITLEKMRNKGVVAQLENRLSFRRVFLHCTGNKASSFDIAYGVQFDVFVDLDRNNGTILLRSLSCVIWKGLYSVNS
jgi:hypothetical protein